MAFSSKFCLIALVALMAVTAISAVPSPSPDGVGWLVKREEEGQGGNGTDNTDSDGGGDSANKDPVVVKDIKYEIIAFPAEYENSAEKVNITDPDGKILAKNAPKAFKIAFIQEMNGYINGKLLSAVSCSTGIPGVCAVTLESSPDIPYGFTHQDRPLNPFVSFFSDDLPVGSVYKVDELINKTISGSKMKHNGCIRVDEDCNWGHGCKSGSGTLLVGTMRNYKEVAQLNLEGYTLHKSSESECPLQDYLKDDPLLTAAPGSAVVKGM
ncbi:hypothetical protein BJ684DRAFT_14956 [Piptocephalis cylindrospora]|uniref:Uncharacterized protein n=1 Tax=Piptocephalis cylindrospora TaxID=1907219 RepID=A0A4V1IYJ0_9FUNG|nr:hypothetical protein BJ684DRAFT_14956 [Piptocephalis cylindrospora]|eukprot:RKP14729.1 hypothetical protein BJ684DRAFT_14956 [Piptocephalis cylindrospora]